MTHLHQQVALQSRGCGGRTRLLGSGVPSVQSELGVFPAVAVTRHYLLIHKYFNTWLSCTRTAGYCVCGYLEPWTAGLLSDPQSNSLTVNIPIPMPVPPSTGLLRSLLISRPLSPRLQWIHCTTMLKTSPYTCEIIFNIFLWSLSLSFPRHSWFSLWEVKWLFLFHFLPGQVLGSHCTIGDPTPLLPALCRWYQISPVTPIFQAPFVYTPPPHGQVRSLM